MTANLAYLNKLIDQYDNNYHHFIRKNTYWCRLYCLDVKNWDES